MIRTWKIMSSICWVVMIAVSLKASIATAFLIIRPSTTNTNNNKRAIRSGFNYPLGCGCLPTMRNQRRLVSSEIYYRTDGEVIGNGVDNNADVGLSAEEEKEEEEEEFPLLTGLVVKEKYILTEYIPVASQKCELYEAYQQRDYHTRQYPFAIKLSSSLEQIDLEYENYRYVSNRLSAKEECQQTLFVKIYDKIEEAEYDPGAKSNNGRRRRMAGIVMERGTENLRFNIQQNGAFRGIKLRNAIQKIISIVGALHEIKMVWTEIKAENFVITPAPDNTIKGIDLESVVIHNQLIRMYTAEACPPEFPIQEMYQSLPAIRMDYSFDMWGLGMTLFEVATGRPYYQDGLTNLEYIKGMLCDPNKLIAHRDSNLVSIEPAVRNIIQQCLQVDPMDRTSCRELLRDPYFTTDAVEAAVCSSVTSNCVNKGREEQRDDKIVSSDFGNPNLVAAPEDTDIIQFQDENSSRTFHALEGHGLSVELKSTLSDALDVCSKHDPYIVKNFAFQLQIPVSSLSEEDEENNVNKNNKNRGGIPKIAYKSLLDIIHVCSAHDRKTAIKLLSLFENEIIQKGNRQDDDGILAP